MTQDRKYFLSPDSGLDADSAPFAVSQNAWINAENIRVGSTDNGEIGGLESIGSTTLLHTPGEGYTCIGACADEARSRLVYALWHADPDKHCILCLEAGTVYTVLTGAQVAGGLNFSRDSLIHSSRVIDGVWYFTDWRGQDPEEDNEPRRLSLDSGIRLNHPAYPTEAVAYTAPLEATALTVVRRAPQYPLRVVKKEDPAFPNNFIAEEPLQFGLRYRYRTHEYSVIGAWSELAAMNEKDAPENYAEVTLPTQEVVDGDVWEADLVVRFGNRSGAFVVHTFSRSDLDAHNAGTALTHAFYNDVIGTALDAAYAAKPFDSVPLRSATLETARARLFLGNNVEGYDTPAASSLTTEVVEAEDGAEEFGRWKILTVDYDGVVNTYYCLYFTYRQPCVYYWAAIAPPAAPPTTVTLADATHATADYYELARLLTPLAPDATTLLPYDAFSVADGGGATASTGSGAQSLAGTRAFKSNGTYRIATWFFDRYRRKCGVVYREANKLTTPDRSYAQTVYNTGIAWALDNTGAADEIPAWAYYYAVGRTHCLTTRHFLQGRAAALAYVEKEDDGTLTYLPTDAYATTHYALAIDLTALVGFGLGYAYQDGDLVNLYFQTGPAEKHTLSVIGQDGKWLLVQLLDAGTLAASVTPLVEIYTPYRAGVDEFFYEVGQIYAVQNPATPERTYSVTSGTLNGDVYLLQRTVGADNYFVEAMSPNDKRWTEWHSDLGWPNVIDRVGQVHKTTSLSWSETLVPGTRTRGLSAFNALDEKTLPLECGALRKLQLTSKIAGEPGVVLLALCEGDAVSLYMGEQQLVGAAGNAFVAQSAEVIGTFNVLKGGYGTRNPESVAAYRGLVFWYDVRSAKLVQYSANGLFPISNYRLTRFFKRFTEQYNAMTSGEISALGSRPFVLLQVDPAHDELLVVLPTLLATPPKGYLPDYPATAYPFDLWDGRGKTLVFRLSEEPNFWQGSYSMTPEGWATVGSTLYSFKNGSLYGHNSTESQNEFYGETHKSKVMLVSNALPSVPKTYHNLVLEASQAPAFTYLYSKDPYEQCSDLVEGDWSESEGLWQAPLYRNKLVPQPNGTVAQTGLLTGERLRSRTMLVLMEFEPDAMPLQIRFVTLSLIPSRGQTAQLKTL
jgi:hypothetical protein